MVAIATSCLSSQAHPLFAGPGNTLPPEHEGCSVRRWEGTIARMTLFGLVAVTLISLLLAPPPPVDGPLPLAGGQLPAGHCPHEVPSPGHLWSRCHQYRRWASKVGSEGRQKEGEGPVFASLGDDRRRGPGTSLRPGRRVWPDDFVSLARREKGL